jgi:hypothetical protein
VSDTKTTIGAQLRRMLKIAKLKDQLAAVNTEVARQTGIAKDWLRYATEVAHALGRCHCSDSGCYPGNLSVALERVKELTDAEEELSQLKAQLTAKPAIPMVDHYSTAPALPTEAELVSAVESGAGCSPGSPTCADIARAVLDLLVGKGVQAERTSEVRRETCPVHGAGKGGNG